MRLTTMLLIVAVFMTVSSLAVSDGGRAADQFAADADFVRRAEQAGNQEMADARSALASSKDSAVQTVAKLLQTDGAQATRRLAALAVEKGWPSPPLDPPDLMSHYSDRGYAANQIRAEQDAIALYAEEAANGADSDLQEFARAALPALRRRLDSLRLLRSS
jgi:putative membrane protein